MNSKWNNKTVEKEALKYNRRIDFKNGSRGAYTYACKNNLMDKICKHMKSGYLNINIDNNITVNEKQPTIRRIWDFESCKIEAAKYSRRIDFRDNCAGAYKHALKCGYMDKICSHMIHLKGTKKIISKKDIKIDKLFKLASKYTELKDFRKKEYNAYYACKNLGIFNEATAHMIRYKYLNNNNYSFEECLNNALNVKFIGEFKNHFYNQYNYCKSKDWIDQISLILDINKLIRKNNQAINDLENEIKEYNGKIGFCCGKLQNLKDINSNSLNAIENIKNLNI